MSKVLGSGNFVWMAWEFTRVLLLKLGEPIAERWLVGRELWFRGGLGWGTVLSGGDACGAYGD